ncbi:MAG: prepilin-type N-terminal cleavage/methylation domain-containing protein [Helicobacteraceae bacterium]|jgi:prepilin-type N-terminal cleavage/methylation domain-containing protein|nr:prepilin-type N-terminal cleavage/methylation domain-containing protein [Helicobacteraceae bacterium]
MRGGFTLIELIVSVAILFLLVFFLAHNHRTLQMSLDQSLRYEAIEQSDDDLISLLIRDIVQSDEINIARGREYDQLYLGGSRSSLRGFGRTNIAYVALKPSASLIRIEAPFSFRVPVERAEAYRYHFLPFGQPLDSFKIYKSQKRDQNDSACSVLIYIAPKEKEPRLLELGLLNASAC